MGMADGGIHLDIELALAPYVNRTAKGMEPNDHHNSMPLRTHFGCTLSSLRFHFESLLSHIRALRPHASFRFFILNQTLYDSTLVPLRTNCYNILACLRLHFELVLLASSLGIESTSMVYHFDLTPISLRAHFDLTSAPPRYHLKFTSISFRTHFDLKLMSLRHSFDFTSNSLSTSRRYHFVFSWYTPGGTRAAARA